MQPGFSKSFSLHIYLNCRIKSPAKVSHSSVVPNPTDSAPNPIDSLQTSCALRHPSSIFSSKRLKNGPNVWRPSSGTNHKGRSCRRLRPYAQHRLLNN